MTQVPSFRPQSSGDGWVEGRDGEKFWGLFGAAGLLVHDRDRGILMQHRSTWSHFGGTWGLPGGARHENETAYDAAVREAGEEADVPADAISPLFESVLDLGFWSYTTVAVETTRPFEPRISDPESLELRWIPVDELTGLALHPFFARSWPELRARL
ncbi:NUDIX domain-containing protein [Salinibacterium hongtaonis]|uniref:NUDIX hydrolase n=1 Tax=Homoserinimonas hongtaonis TaxID=2079791 RepID=A0A2U1SXT8_9MICO|nr:NUDIX hydrolase [Salinibacterium hongtaonis]AWB88957.1 NUDIX hydrolase [Salinibacterium hongtaonis]PWB96419.1 NUDIX hydrolase [Salinibacterium hongtaonis]